MGRNDLDKAGLFDLVRGSSFEQQPVIVEWLRPSPLRHGFSPGSRRLPAHIVHLHSRSEETVPAFHPLSLHTPASAHSAKHLPSWWMLSASAGIVNSTAFLASERFVSHMSGAATRIGLNGVSDLVSDALILLVSFIVGAGVSVVAVDARIRQHKKPLHWMSLGAVSGILILVAMAGREGFLGPFDAADVSWGLIVPLSFSMGLLNASVATATSMVVRTTHVTGPATDSAFTSGARSSRSVKRVVVSSRRRSFVEEKCSGSSAAPSWRCRSPDASNT